MQVNSLQVCSINRKHNPQFRGTVSPEFVQYVNELRQDCLETASKSKAEQINKACDRILKTSTEGMEKCFHPLSVLTINYDSYNNCDVIQVKSIAAKDDATIPNAGFLSKKGQGNPNKMLDALNMHINSGCTFSEATAKELLLIRGLIHILSKSGDYNGNKESFDNMLEILKWWKEHISLLPKDIINDRCNMFNKTYSGIISELTQQIENLKNASEETTKENK